MVLIFGTSKALTNGCQEGWLVWSGCKELCALCHANGGMSCVLSGFSLFLG